MKLKTCIPFDFDYSGLTHQGQAQGIKVMFNIKENLYIYIYVTNVLNPKYKLRLIIENSELIYSKFKHFYLHRESSGI